MVQLMLSGFGGDKRLVTPLAVGAGDVPSPFGVECYHVNARVSNNLEDIGELRLGKFLLLLGYCLQAIWCRFRHGVTAFYYIPAPGKASALYRDWLVMCLCRPFFKTIVLHWHAAGLARWLETVVQMRWRSLTYRFMKKVDMSIVLTNHNRLDAEKLYARRVAVVANGIPDPCPDFDARLLARRQARIVARQMMLAGQTLSSEQLAAAGPEPDVFKVLFLAHCTREKGLFDALESFRLLQQRLAHSGTPLNARLIVAGEFINPSEKKEFEKKVAELHSAAGPAPEDRPLVEYAGFVSGARKRQLFEDSDCFCFPTYHYAESFGLVIIEAMAFGLPVVASRWRSIPELMPPGDSGLVPTHQPPAVADALFSKLTEDQSTMLRAYFVQRFTLEEHLRALARAMHEAEAD